MPLSGYPLTTKYAYSDFVFILIAGRIECTQIASWRVVVDDPGGEGEGRQRTWYKFTDFGNMELIENKVYSSRNSLLYGLKGEGLYLNVAGESRTGGSSIFKSIVQTDIDEPVSLGDWFDMAGFDLRYAKFKIPAFPWTASGLASITSGSDQLIGVDTEFTYYFSVGDIILINHINGNPTGCIRRIKSIESDEALTLTSNANTNYSNVKVFSYIEISNTIPKLLSGTINMNTGTNVINGTLTQFTNLQVNDIIALEHPTTGNRTTYIFAIASIVSDTQLTTYTNKTGGTATGYFIRHYSDLLQDVVQEYTYHGNGSSPEEIEGEPTMVFDGAIMTGALLPSAIDTKTKFRNIVRSYDADSTIWTDGQPIGRP